MITNPYARDTAETMYWTVVLVLALWYLYRAAEARISRTAREAADTAVEFEQTGWDHRLTPEEQDRLENGEKVTVGRYHGGELVLTGTEVHPDGEAD